jgi:hypothetical protein
MVVEIMMEIEIKFGKGRSDNVLVYHGDDPMELAQVSSFSIFLYSDCQFYICFKTQQFISRHNLKLSSVPIITQYLKTTIDDFLAANSYSNVSSEDDKENFSAEKIDTDTNVNSFKGINRAEGIILYA